MKYYFNDNYKTWSEFLNKKLDFLNKEVTEHSFYQHYKDYSISNGEVNTILSEWRKQTEKNSIDQKTFIKKLKSYIKNNKGTTCIFSGCIFPSVTDFLSCFDSTAINTGSISIVFEFCVFTDQVSFQNQSTANTLNYSFDSLHIAACLFEGNAYVGTTISFEKMKTIERLIEQKIASQQKILSTTSNYPIQLGFLHNKKIINEVLQSELPSSNTHINTCTIAYSIFNKKLSFNQCCFDLYKSPSSITMTLDNARQPMVALEQVICRGDVEFIGSRFGNEQKGENYSASQVLLLRVEFEKRASFTFSHFNAKTEFRFCKCLDNIKFDYTTFSRTVEYYLCQFTISYFKAMSCNHDVIFRNSSFEHALDLRNSRINRCLNLSESRFDNSILLEGSAFGENDNALPQLPKFANVTYRNSNFRFDKIKYSLPTIINAAIHRAINQATDLPIDADTANREIALAQRLARVYGIGCLLLCIGIYVFPLPVPANFLLLTYSTIAFVAVYVVPQIFKILVRLKFTHQVADTSMEYLLANAHGIINRLQLLRELSEKDKDSVRKITTDILYTREYLLAPCEFLNSLNSMVWLTYTTHRLKMIAKSFEVVFLTLYKKISDNGVAIFKPIGCFFVLSTILHFYIVSNYSRELPNFSIVEYMVPHPFVKEIHLPYTIDTVANELNINKNKIFAALIELYRVLITILLFITGLGINNFLGTASLHKYKYIKRKNTSAGTTPR
ncbi:MAG: hypothetical protein QM538_05755 [Methylacidiphilales bacterium]|nr:hypothetical protein [Candidatus Methylacidiphilales bacterium]